MDSNSLPESQLAKKLNDSEEQSLYNLMKRFEYELYCTLIYFLVHILFHYHLHIYHCVVTLLHLIYFPQRYASKHDIHQNVSWLDRPFAVFAFVHSAALSAAAARGGGHGGGGTPRRRPPLRPPPAARRAPRMTRRRTGTAATKRTNLSIFFLFDIKIFVK